MTARVRGTQLPSPAGRSRAARGYQPEHAPGMPFALLVVGMLVGGMCALLGLNTAAAANELARHNLASKDSSVSAQLEQVRNEVAASSAPGSLASAAAALGMVPAGAPAFLTIGPGGKVTLRGSPAPVTSVAVAPPAVKPPKATPTKTRAVNPTTKPTTTATTTPTTAAKPTTAARPTTTAAPQTAKATPTATPTPHTTLPGGPR